MTTRTRKPTAERREEIAKAVLRIVGEQGLTSLTMTKLAQEVGLTSGALFRHFASRSEILREVVRFGVHRIEQTFPDPALPPVDRLFQLARNRAYLLGSEPGLAWLLRSEQASLSLPEDGARQLGDLVERSKQYLLGALREGVSQGDIRADIEPEILLVFVMGTIHALVGMPGPHRLVSSAKRPDPDRVLSALECVLAPTGKKTREAEWAQKSKPRTQENRR